MPKEFSSLVWWLSQGALTHTCTGRRPCHARSMAGVAASPSRRLPCRRRLRDPTQAADYKEPVCGCLSALGSRRRRRREAGGGAAPQPESVRPSAWLAWHGRSKPRSAHTASSQLTNAGDLHYFRLARCRPGRFSHFHLPAPNQSAHRPFCADASFSDGFFGAPAWAHLDPFWTHFSHYMESSSGISDLSSILDIDWPQREEFAP